MSTPPSDDADYPYQVHRNMRPDVTAAAQWQARLRWIRRWLARIAVLIGVPSLVLAACIGFVTFRAARQAWVISHLERCGSSVSYWHQGSAGQDFLPGHIRERLNDRWWGQVREVTISDGGYWEGLLSFRETDENDIRQILAACKIFPHLRVVSAQTNHFSCDQLERWPHLDRLEEVKLESTKLKDADLAVIAKMTHLRSLSIASASLTCKGLKHIGQLPNLEHLTMEKATFDGSCADSNQPFRALKSLVLGRSPGFNDDVIALFGSPPNLEEINFNATPIGDSSLARLMRSGKIRSLIINAGEITDAGMGVLADYPAPRWLVLSRMPLTDAGLALLAGKDFPVLILDHTAVTDDAFRALNRIDGIEYVSLDNSHVTGTGVCYVNSDVQLQHLDVGGPALTADGIRALAAAPVQELSLGGSSFGDSELMFFVNNDKLVRLTIPHTQVTDAGLAAFFAARRKRLSGREDALVIMRDPYWNVVDSARTILDSSNGQID